ncbi:histone deacetylase 2 isoform X4 [Phoenix dactylifera]|uniref:Histone deacetylase 2 isoform X4 n=1 Tax=Phoenix dactylifera TaxID=42345 RepID=A0A8B9APF8_PHODC|nr:histone deacetylase 2 isoform X4 [Phoenix dactylifera]
METASSSSAVPELAGASATLRRNRILSSKLYVDVPLSKVPLIYSTSYDIAFLGIEKLYPLLQSFQTVLCSIKCFIHSANSLQVGGSILAAKLAIERGWAINVGGGFHHCSAEKGGGFCAYADISLCIHFAFVRLNISRVMIIDLDAHQGNGHEIDFSDDRRVYILDIYNSGIYPFDLEARRYIDQKVELLSGTKTNEYLEQLDKALEVAGNNFNPELVVYNAGTDILDGDPLGRLKVSPEGVSIRDEKVFRFARERNVPLLMLTSGGYMKSSAQVIADSIINLSGKKLIDLDSPLRRK